MMVMRLVLGLVCVSLAWGQKLPEVGSEFAGTEGAPECEDLFFEGSVPAFAGGPGKPECGQEPDCQEDEACVAFIYEDILAFICEPIPVACEPLMSTGEPPAPEPPPTQPPPPAPTNPPPTAPPPPPTTTEKGAPPPVPTQKPVTPAPSPDTTPPDPFVNPPVAPPTPAVTSGANDGSPVPSSPTAGGSNVIPSLGYTPDELCCIWAAKGECDTNPDWMRVFCDIECGTVGCSLGSPPSTCMGTYNAAKCGPMAGGVGPAVGGTGGGGGVDVKELGELEKALILAILARAAQLKLMDVNVATSAPVTASDATAPASCTNAWADSTKCTVWASVGECEKNGPWMRTFCAADCKSCNGTTGAGTGGAGTSVVSPSTARTIRIVLQMPAAKARLAVRQRRHRMRVHRMLKMRALRRRALRLRKLRLKAIRRRNSVMRD